MTDQQSAETDNHFRLDRTVKRLSALILAATLTVACAGNSDKQPCETHGEFVAEGSTYKVVRDADGKALGRVSVHDWPGLYENPDQYLVRLNDSNEVRVDAKNALASTNDAAFLITEGLELIVDIQSGHQFTTRCETI